MNKSHQHNSVILANNISYEVRSDFPIVENITVSLGISKYGLVGKNGAGKTTLLRLLVGEIIPTRGEVQRYKTIAYLPQDHNQDLHQSVAQAIGVKHLLDALHKIKKGSTDIKIMEIIEDNWDIEDRITKIFHNFQIDNIGLDRTVGSLSGGERTKIVIAKLLISNPDFLILDEPTNNLDHDSREIMYQLVKNWNGGLLVVSHDRQLLNLVEHILELSHKGLKSYGGNYENYVLQKEFEKQSAERQLTSAEQDLRKTKIQSQKTKERQLHRSIHGKKVGIKSGIPKILLGKMKETSETTSSRLSALHARRIDSAQDKVAIAKAKISPENQIVVDLSGARVPAGKLIVKMEKLSFYYDKNKRLFDNFTFSIFGPARIALNGPNGSGKTTLVKLMMQELQPTTGEIVVGADKVSYLDQNVAVLDKEKNLVENVRYFSGYGESQSRKWLGRFLFHKEDVFKKTAVLSGGERMRAALSCILAGDNLPQLLILDEPTNNLDLDSIQQIESILSNYQGALIVISHDKTFLVNIGINDEIRLPQTNN